MPCTVLVDCAASGRHGCEKNDLRQHGAEDYGSQRQPKEGEPSHALQGRTSVDDSL